MAAQKSLIDCTASFCVACGFSRPHVEVKKNARDECALSDFSSCYFGTCLWPGMSDALLLSAEEINISASDRAEKKNLFLNSRFRYPHDVK